MLILDSIITAPFYGLMAIFEKISEEVEKEIQLDAERIKYELMELYTMLESGVLSEVDFEKQEQLLLDKLDSLEDKDD